LAHKQIIAFYHNHNNMVALTFFFPFSFFWGLTGGQLSSNA
jgi:hypothetical protein